MAEGAPRLACWNETALHFGKLRAIHHQHASAHGGEITQSGSERIVCGKLVIGLHGVVRLYLSELGSSPQARQHAIAGRRLRSNFGQDRFGLCVLSLFAQPQCGLECGASGSGFFGLPPFISTPGSNSRDDEDGQRDDVDTITIPQLLKPFAPDFLVNFMKNIGHDLLQVPLVPAPGANCRVN